MAEIKLFRLGNQVEEIKSVETSFDVNLEQIIEDNSKSFFGVTFVANNYVIGSAKIPTVGLDENRCPVVFVYAKDEKMNFLSKGLFYVEQILNNKEKFTSSVSVKLGKKASEVIDWSCPRIICIATGFNKYDRTAVTQLSRNVSLIQYNQYGDDIVMFELIESNAGQPSEEGVKYRNSFITSYKKSNADIREIFDMLCEYVEYFGEGVTVSQLRNYVAFKKIKNFGAARAEGDKIILNLNLEPAKYVGRDPKIKDVTFAAKLGTGLVQFTVENAEDYEVAKKLLLDAYNRN